MRLKLLAFTLLLLAGVCWGQLTPDCQFTVAFTTNSPQSPAFNNKPTTTGGGTGCISWVVDYWTNGASSVSVKIEGAPDVAGSPGSYSSLTALSNSANPATGTTRGGILAGYDYYPWIRINPSTFTGSSQTMTVRVYGYRSLSALAGSGAGGITQLTQDVLAGPGSGSLAATVVGLETVPFCSGFSPTNGQFVQYTTGSSPNPCYTAASATGTNAASIIAYTPGATVTLTCPSATLGTVNVFAPSGGAALAANMALSYAACTPGQDVRVQIKQAASGGPYTVTGLPTGCPQISPVASVTTTYLLHSLTATTMACDGYVADSGPGVVTESAAPSGNPPSGLGFVWDDSTNHIFSFKNPSGVVSNTAVPVSCSSGQLFSALSASGVLTCSNVTQINGATVPASQPILASNGSSQIIGATVTGTGTTAVLSVNPTFTQLASSWTDSSTAGGLGVNLYAAATPASAPSATYTGGQSVIQYNSTADTTHQVVGFTATGEIFGNGRANQTIGIGGHAINDGTASSVLTSSLYGGYFDCANTSTGRVTHCVGIKINTPVNAGTLTANFGLYVQAQTPTGGGTTGFSTGVHLEGLGADNAVSWGNNDGTKNTYLYSSAANVLDVIATGGINLTATSGNVVLNQNSLAVFTSVASGAFADTLKLNAGNVQMLVGGLLQFGGGTTLGRVGGSSDGFIRGTGGNGVAVFVNGGSQASISNASFYFDVNSHFNFSKGKGQHFNTQAATSDVSGTITISNPATTGAVNFATAYSNAPSCVITPTTNQLSTILSYWVTTATGSITANVQIAPSSAITFTYLCTGNPN